MRIARTAFILILFTGLMVLSGCGSSVPTVAELLKQKGISGQAASDLKVELRFLKESKGSNYKFIEMSGKTDFLNELLSSMAACKACEKPKDSQFSPELRSDCELYFTGSTGGALSFYYISQNNLLVYPDLKKDKNGDTLQYLYFTVDAKLAGLIQGQQQNAKLKQENVVKTFRNMEELKSSIDPDELAEEGTELGFEFYTQATPANTGTACCIYTSTQFSALPPDSFIITAYGKTKTGMQQKLNILGMEANSYYTKVLVAEPDDALDSVDTGQAVPESYAATVKKNAIDRNKWIVFVDADNTILDVIVPEDIEGMNQIPETSALPSDSAGPEDTQIPEPAASADEVGSGD